MLAHLRSSKPHQHIAGIALLYAAYITYKCPCRRTISCHYPHYFLSVGLATGIVLYDNGRRV